VNSLYLVGPDSPFAIDQVRLYGLSWCCMAVQS